MPCPSFAIARPCNSSSFTVVFASIVSGDISRRLPWVSVLKSVLRGLRRLRCSLPVANADSKKNCGCECGQEGMFHRNAPRLHVVIRQHTSECRPFEKSRSVSLISQAVHPRCPSREPSRRMRVPGAPRPNFQMYLHLPRHRYKVNPAAAITPASSNCRPEPCRDSSMKTLPAIAIQTGSGYSRIL